MISGLSRFSFDCYSDPEPGRVNGPLSRDFSSFVGGPEAFLARRIGGVHLLARDEEPAQRPGCPLGCVLGWVRDVGFWLCHRNRSSHPRRSTTALWRSTPGASCESYWASRGDATTGAIVGVEGKRIRTPGAVV